MRASAVGVSWASCSGGCEADRRCSRSPCAVRNRNSTSSSAFIASPTRVSARARFVVLAIGSSSSAVWLLASVIERFAAPKRSSKRRFTKRISRRNTSWLASGAKPTK